MKISQLLAPNCTFSFNVCKKFIAAHNRSAHSIIAIIWTGNDFLSFFSIHLVFTLLSAIQLYLFLTLIRCGYTRSRVILLIFAAHFNVIF